MFKFFICYLVADSGNIFCFKDYVLCVAYVKDLSYSMQNPVSPHKTYDSHGSLYLNVSEHASYFAQPIPVIMIFFLKSRQRNTEQTTKKLFSQKEWKRS